MERENGADTVTCPPGRQEAKEEVEKLIEELSFSPLEGKNASSSSSSRQTASATDADIVDAKDQLIHSLTEELIKVKEHLAIVMKEKEYFQRKALWVTSTDSKILSNVITTTEHWYGRTWLLLHEPIRQALFDFEDLVIQSPSFDPVKYPWKVDNFFYYFNNAFAPYVRRHHDAEENYYLPWVASKAEIPDCLTSNHEAFEQMLREVEDSETEYKDIVKRDNEKGDKLATSLYTWRSTLILRLSMLAEHLKEHMDEEERFFPATVHHYFSQKEEYAILEKMGSVKAAHYELPMVLQAMEIWGTVQIREDFLNRLSAPARYTLNSYWMSAFKKNIQKCLESLALEEPPPTTYVPLLSAPALVVATPVFFLCSIQ